MSVSALLVFIELALLLSVSCFLLEFRVRKNRVLLLLSAGHPVNIQNVFVDRVCSCIAIFSVWLLYSWPQDGFSASRHHDHVLEKRRSKQWKSHTCWGCPSCLENLSFLSGPTFISLLQLCRVATVSCRGSYANEYFNWADCHSELNRISVNIK